MVGAYKQTLIQARSNKDSVRKHIEVYFGHNDIRGAQSAVSEIIMNAVDEAVEGHADTITITVGKDNSLTVEDNGWGVPMGYNSEQEKFNWELVFCTLFASGKYKGNEDGYKSDVLGKHGVGCSATQYSSEFMDITSTSLGVESSISFYKGDVSREFVERKLPESEQNNRGTKIHFKLDSEVFTDIEISEEFYNNVARYSTLFVPNLTIYLKYKDSTSLKYHFDSPVDYMSRLSRNKGEGVVYLTKAATGVDKAGSDYEKNKYTVNMGAICSFDEEQSFIEIYHNRTPMINKGVTEDAFNKVIVNFFNAEAIKRGLLKKKESFNAADLQSNIYFLGWTSAPGNVSQYAYQNKTAISNPFIGSAYTEFLNEFFAEFRDKQPERFSTYIQKALMMKRAREAGEIAKMKAFKSTSKSSDDLLSMDTKLIPCETNDPEVAELYLAEGDSAMGACKQARDPYFQAIYSLGGKTINCMKNDTKKVFSNETIQGIIKTLGCGVQLSTKVKGKSNIAQFDIDKLKYNKIILATDADVDGKHIRCLALTLFWVYMPELLNQGKVYIVESPLYEIKTRKGSVFAYSDEERDNIVSGLSERYEILRSKGLGENTPEMMEYTTMSPETRRLVQVTPGKLEADQAAMGAFMGEDDEGRKYLISELFSAYANSNDE